MNPKISAAPVDGNAHCWDVTVDIPDKVEIRIRVEDAWREGEAVQEAANSLHQLADILTVKKELVGATCY